MGDADAPTPALGGTRREARERAVELLYEADAKGVDPADVIDPLPIRPDPYAVELAVGVADHRIEIDRLLDAFSRSWSVARMAAMDRTVLRMGVFELATQLEVPTGVCLSEAVELGGQYGSTDDTSKFVNGILAKVAEVVRPDADSGRPWSPIDVVVFDMDGVIRHWEGQRSSEFESEHGLPAGTVASVAFAQPRFDQANDGTLTAEQWAEGIGADLAEQHGVDAALAAEMWLTTDWALDDDMVALLRRLHEADTRIALFSNASTRLEADMGSMGITELFDVVASSSRIGLMKPAVEAFEHVAGMVDVDDPARLLFVDDRPENVAGAVDAGWHAVQMRSASRLVGVLRRLGVPGA